MHSGLGAWLVQRFTALWMLFFLAFVLRHFALHPPGSFEQWRAWVASPLVCIAALLFVLSMLLHAWIGLRDVLIDYVHPVALRMPLLAALCLGLAGLGLWALQILLLAGPCWL